jgi:hypothetical protein
MSIAPAIRDNTGTQPCLPPHILGRLLDKLRERIGAEKQTKTDPWECIDRLARQMESRR